jgi:hypothetical protein
VDSGRLGDPVERSRAPTTNPSSAPVASSLRLVVASSLRLVVAAGQPSPTGGDFNRFDVTTQPIVAPVTYRGSLRETGGGIPQEQCL